MGKVYVQGMDAKQPSNTTTSTPALVPLRIWDTAYRSQSYQGGYQTLRKEESAMWVKEVQGTSRSLPLRKNGEEEEENEGNLFDLIQQLLQ